MINVWTFVIAVQNKTSIWVLNKQRWIQGPRIPNKLSGNTDLNCVQALNSTTAIFISKDSAVSYFDFKTWKWTWSDIRILPDFYDIGFGMISCAMTHTKLGEMLVYIMGFVARKKTSFEKLFLI